VYKDKQWMEEQYVRRRRSTCDIARECGTYSATVRTWVIRHGFEPRGLKESQSGWANGAWVDAPFKDKKVFHADYVGENLSLGEMAAKYRVGKRTIARWRIKHKIPRKKEKDFKRPRGEKHPCYVNGRGGKPKDCEDCGTPIHRKSRWCFRCRNKHFAGDGNPNFKGVADIMVLVRSWVREYWTPHILRRDNYTCQRCGDNTGGNLQAHHMRGLADIVHAVIRRHKLANTTKEGRLKAVEVILRSRLVRSRKNGVTLCTSCHRKEHQVCQM
jgi:hypothetical protein